MWPEVDRRDPNRPDRRAFPRGGRRDTDLPYAVFCVLCDSPLPARGRGRSEAGTWCCCARCGHTWLLRADN